MSKESWEGPLPPPKVLEEFKAISPDFPERIFQQWEQESKHRRLWEATALDAQVKKEMRGQFGAIIFALGALLVSAFALHLGHQWVALTLGGGTIASVVGAFLYSRSK
jgi:uncharacterized membrane protein